MSTEITEIDLYRSVLKENYPNGTVIDYKPAQGVLYPDFEDRPLSDNKIRRADVVLTKDKKHIYAGGGTSVFDKPDVFRGSKWTAFQIPAGTLVPASLVIRHTGFNKRFDANHYQIESRMQAMRVDAYKGALDNLARNAVVRSIELAKKE